MENIIEIPEGYEARIESNKVILEPKEKTEEERIRKAIIKHFKVGTDYITFSGFSKEQIIAWLEKKGEKNERTKHPDMVANLKEYLANTPKEQLEKDWDELKHWNNVGPMVEEFLYGKQNHSGKVEPKFKVGDWVVLSSGSLSEILQIVRIDLTSNYYWFDDDSFLAIVDEDCLHLWTIKDAEDGDVLSCENGWTCIFKALDNHTNTFSSYCFMDKKGWFCECGGQGHTLDNRIGGEIHPSTKEQCDLLFQKMKEAEYEWDAEKKELIKIEQNPAENEELTEFDKAVGVSIGTWNPKTPEQIQAVKAVSKKLLKLAKKQINDEQNPAWSEEDEKNLNSVERIIENSENLNKVFDTINSPEYIKKHFIDWFKSFKERIQPNQSLHPRYIEGKGIYIPVIDVVLNMQDEPEKLTWDMAKDIALSKEQMLVVLYYKDEINDLLEQHGGQKLEGWYWSSTHFSSARLAWGISFNDLRVRDDSCNYFYKVRAFSDYHSES